MTESDTTDITEINDSEISEISDHDLQVGITLCSLTYLDEDDSNPDRGCCRPHRDRSASTA